MSSPTKLPKKPITASTDTDEVLATRFREEAIRKATLQMSRGSKLLPVSYLNLDEEQLDRLIKHEQQLQMQRLSELKSKLFGSKQLNE
jgi:hypothetical protein